MNGCGGFWAALIWAGGLCVFGYADAAGFVRVAYDDAGAEDARQLHLVEADGPWRFDNPGTSDEALRTAVFGKRIELGYLGLNPRAAYTARLRFFSDGLREVRVKAGNKSVLASVIMEKGKPVERKISLPPETYATGKLILVIEQVRGSNAVISDIEVLSTDPATLAPISVPPLSVTPIIPRLSPRPASVDGLSTVAVDLAGTWRFNPMPQTDFWQEGAASQESAPGWSPIQVPGEWVMQGFEVKPNKAAGYRRVFTIPKEWAGRRVKLRCDGVYSDATVWINGKRAGHHLGGFTPFELDVTEQVQAGGENVIALAVTNESEADRLASGTQYACHVLGGIPRGIRLFALPAVHVASLFVTTRFDAAFRDATLGIELCSANEGERALSEVRAAVSLTSADGAPVPLDREHIDVGALNAGQKTMSAAAISVAKPLKWDNEHPNLYTLTVRLEAGGKTLETLVQRIGFRQVEIRGNRMFVNNRPVKLRGVNRHEVYPLTGRSVPAGLHRRDVELFREANVNLLRTCHYPPDEALMEAADELGMFIECEAPFCWSPVPFSRAPKSGPHRNLICQQTAEMVLTYRNHPSVLFWSLANESRWGAHFVEASKLVRELDPTRPQTFNNPADPKYTEITNLHYPGHGGPAKGRDSAKNPVYLGEDCHLNAYNRLELATDPALRDLWGRYVREMWDDIYDSEGCLGQSIWAGIDDTFYLKGDLTVGYGTWGPIDGWRRQKPEYWGMKKAYSPVRILNAGSLAVSNGVVSVAVQNRQNFSDMSEMRIGWKVGGLSGAVAPGLAPRSQGVFRIALNEAPGAGAHLELTFSDPRGFVADQFRLPLVRPADPTAPVAGVGTAPCAVTESAEDVTVDCGAFKWTVSKAAGRLVAVDAGSARLPLNGPQLMLLPLNKTGDTQMLGKTKIWEPFTEPCAGWVCAKVRGVTERDQAKVTVAGRYDGAEGAYTMTFAPDGRVDVAYSFTVSKDVNPRQIGLVFSLPRAYEVFSWERKGYWDVYPEDHIARLKGTARASEGFEATSVGPRMKPAHPWRLDKLPYGNNDFCSTKHHVIQATLANAEGRGVTIDGRATQHVRCWLTAEAVNFIVADYSNGGSEKFLHGFVKKEERPLKAGNKVEGVIRLFPLLKSERPATR